MAERTNILFIITDQQSHNALSCCGNEDLHTPNLDRLAERGVRFTNAYSTNPVCTPSRGSMFTGRMPHEVSIYANKQGIAEAFREQELGTLFKAGGYSTAYAGKWHVPNSLRIGDEHGFEVLSQLDDPNVAVTCSEYLGRRHDRPFLLVASFDNPHNICEGSRFEPLPGGEVGEPPAVADCPLLPPNFQPPTDEPEMLRINRKLWRRVQRDDEFTEDDWRRLRWTYYRLVERVDAQVGQILDALDEAKLTETTLVAFCSDHGDCVGAHRWMQKFCLYEESVRVPMILAGPGVKAASQTGNRTDARLVSSGLDLMPTLLAAAGIDGPRDLRGENLLDENSSRQAVYSEAKFGAPDYEVSARMVRTERYKYVVHNTGRNAEQLFDLKNDPGEMVSLAKSSKHARTLNDLRRMLWNWLDETNDPFGRHYGTPKGRNLPGWDAYNRK
ncbi:MAG: sulfatase [Phycisphaerae bacterium]